MNHPGNRHRTPLRGADDQRHPAVSLHHVRHRRPAGPSRLPGPFPRGVSDVNISTGGRLGNEVEKTIDALKAQYASNFREICVLWAGKLY
jgi:hypothetical protein